MNLPSFAIFATLVVAATSLQSSTTTRKFSSASKNSRFLNQRSGTSSGQKKMTGSQSMSMFFEGGLKNSKSGVNTSNNERDRADTTTLGNLVVPSMGVGTISWSSKSCKWCHVFSYLVLVKQYPFVSILLTQIEHIVTTLENLELQSLVKESCRTDSALFDTAERYGSHIKTALGVSKRPSYFRE